MIHDKEVATFGAGCFWGVEAAFRSIAGVLETAAGYMGGSIEDPTYEEVCTDQTGHAEVVQVTFDPAVVSYEQLVEVFLQSHDPTQKNRQGPDIGRQYRSVVFTHSQEQEGVVHEQLESLQKSDGFVGRIETLVEPVATFYAAEEYHQRYLEKRGLATCHI